MRKAAGPDAVARGTPYHVPARTSQPAMRLILIVPIVFVVACGALFGVLNGARVPLDFYFTSVEMPLGIALLGTLLLGWVLGGLVAWLGHAPRLRSEMRMLRRELNRVQEGCRAPDPDHA